MYLGLSRIPFQSHLQFDRTNVVPLCTRTSETMPNTQCLNVEGHKDAVCIIVVPKNIGLVYIPVMSSKVAVLAGITESAETV